MARRPHPVPRGNSSARVPKYSRCRPLDLSMIWRCILVKDNCAVAKQLLSIMNAHTQTHSHTTRFPPYRITEHIWDLRKKQGLRVDSGSEAQVKQITWSQPSTNPMPNLVYLYTLTHISRVLFIPEYDKACFLNHWHKQIDAWGVEIAGNYRGGHWVLGFQQGLVGHSKLVVLKHRKVLLLQGFDLLNQRIWMAQ